MLLINPCLGKSRGKRSGIAIQVFLGQIAQHFGNGSVAITLQVGHKSIHGKNLASFRHGVLL
ncbi:MAG: hypothetical protein CVU60_06070 [Deltaproteobacteria bacterium HGW-Deltaproteobacteria-18]|nr:MAG: hypothetical protein CVU60_06070 [Deltaproteobacteria bacterium HGW-Deltaproteobacteria-18]